ncbi:carboxylate--amine ligase [Leptospira stimsonii]|uniref:carboxylate--amine ligase n=1 Tax=Leptospira stimsonii TaxID=2202203 RepID=UPI001F50E9F5|nr:carboxylate--amine ligase [Leptospira stimsonii]
MFLYRKNLELPFQPFNSRKKQTIKKLNQNRPKRKSVSWNVSFGKIAKPEFWPAWIFYIPLVPYIVYLTIRHWGFGTICAANPGIDLGGLVGESKNDILKNISSDHILKFHKIIRIDSETDLKNLENLTFINKFEYPYILKPDAGQRGSGVKLIKQENEAVRYLLETNIDLVVQEYHPGPKEAGVFYYRFPNEKRGHIFSVTRKTFPIIEGDGNSSLKELISKHPRFRFQSGIFQQRHEKQWNRILSKGERMRLAEAGNHCQGTLFSDGSDLITEALIEKIDQISQTFAGFYFGRYDIRYRSDEELKLGKEFGIVELNGVTSESTNLYDPEFSIVQMYSILFQQWKLLFQIGSENKKLGVPKASLYKIVKALFRFYAGNRKVDDRSD